jgi:hypothetical protein
MGCDIHLHVEVLIDGKWNYFTNFEYAFRDYKVFSKMADVRNAEISEKDYIKPITAPKGLPDNISELTQIFLNKHDGHSHSWFNLKEIKIFYNWLIKYDFELYHEIRIDRIIIYPEMTIFIPEIDDIRFVFWFDS